VPDERYCGFCIAALDTGARCPQCGLTWEEPLIETEARAFRAGWQSRASESPIVDGWLAVAKWREHGRPLPTVPPEGDTTE
jgi:hypothetical protein